MRVAHHKGLLCAHNPQRFRQGVDRTRADLNEFERRFMRFAACAGKLGWRNEMFNGKLGKLHGNGSFRTMTVSYVRLTAGTRRLRRRCRAFPGAKAKPALRRCGTFAASACKAAIGRCRRQW